MNTTPTHTGLQLRSLVKPEGELELSLASIPTPTPVADEVIVRIEATPINPSDIAMLFGAGDIATASLSGSPGQPVVTMKIPQPAMKSMAARVGQSLPVGNEGAGVVVAAGESANAQSLVGKTVAVLGGAMYTQYRCVKAEQCLVLLPGTSSAEGASAFINPLTSLCMVETMRREGHKALVHTAAASNLGQMLNRICIQDGVPLVNIVRKAEQAALLKSQGATHVCDASSPGFMEELTQAIVASGATLAFDATGGGKLAGQILTCMEAALNRTAKEYSSYGSTTHKQVYIYGGLDTGPTEFNSNFGRAWGRAWSMGGWLVFPFLQKIGPEAAHKLRQRVVSELKTTFASSYSKEISLVEALQPAEIAVYGQRATGTKFLLNPNKGLPTQS
jgi:NADPH2:quinone reductase